MRLEGSFVAIVTPFRNGAVDLPALRALVEWQLAEKTDGFVPCGTTGESATLTAQERADVIRTVIETVKGRAPVIAGAGSNATADCIEQVKRAKELGADGALVVTPYYNKPTQEGLFQHYAAVWEAARFPVVAYNVPGRTACDLLPETVARLAKAGAIVGIKEATANLDRQVQLVEKVGKDAIAYLSGDDFTVLPYIACGGHGVISVIGNIAPRAMHDLVAAARKGDFATARKIQLELQPLHRLLFVESNPIPVKHALHLMGRFTAELRLPLVPMTEGNGAKLRDELKRLKLL